MGDHISDLHDDILCYILSFLTVRDAKRVRSLSSRWKDIFDCRSVLRFDAFTIFGEIPSRELLARGSKFVKVVDQFVENLGANKISALKIKYRLGNEYASHIDAWIASVTGKEVEELDLDFSYRNMSESGGYVLPCHLLHTENRSNLKCLRLKFCHLTLIRDTCTSWLSKLSTIELSSVPLHLSDMECILSSSSNLESLSLIGCELRGKLRVQHPSLKKLVIVAQCRQFELCCPRLEIFEFSGLADFTFSHAPLLSEVSLNLLDGCLFYEYKDNSSVFNDLARNAPQLETLSYWVTSELQVPPSMTMSGLKHLELGVDIPTNFDLLTITNLLYASPVLETLYLKLNFKWIEEFQESSQRQYVDRPHFHLKEVKIKGRFLAFFQMEILEYLLKNGVSLQQMVFILGGCSFRGSSKFTLLQSINPVVDLIVI